MEIINGNDIKIFFFSISFSPSKIMYFLSVVSLETVFHDFGIVQKNGRSAEKP